MRALAGLLLLLCADRAAAQFFDTGAVAGAENSNNTASFKPKFPLNCRPIDFETWELFITLGSAEWCAERYQDEEKNPDGFSAESLKVCTESFSTYLAGVGDPEEPGVNRMFCNVAKMTVDTEMVKMNHYLEAALLSRSHPLVIDHDVKMEFDDWYDRTNLQLLDLFKRGDISGGGPDGEETPQVTEDCANAIGDLMCTYMLPNCTYMPIPRWPYHVLPNWPDIWQEEKDPPINYEKIFPCKEVPGAPLTLTLTLTQRNLLTLLWPMAGWNLVAHLAAPASLILRVQSPMTFNHVLDLVPTSVISPVMYCIIPYGAMWCWTWSQPLLSRISLSKLLILPPTR